jgi:pyruvate dehydrogenase E2 component (dihydrolipoamide acetyltransferase)
VPELLRMPEIATGTTEAVLSSWSVAENSPVSARDVVATVETAKAVVDVEAETDGVILRLLVQPGAEVETGAPIALLGKAGESVTDLDSALRDLGVADVPETPATVEPDSEPSADVAVEVPEAATTPEPSPADDVDVPAPAPPTAGQDQAARSDGHQPGRVFASPLARRLAHEAGLSVEDLSGTGPGGRIVRRDVERAQAEGGAAAPVTQPAAARAGAPGPETGSRAAAGFRDVPHSRLRRLVAERLTESKTTAPHFYLRATVPVDRLLALRAELNDGAETRISVNDLVVKAVARAHVAVPELNVTWQPDAVRHYDSVDVAVAVATDNGLVTPVLRSVEDMTITTVARTTRDLADRARSGQLRQHELEGGSISVTNLGMYGTEELAAIINPPQAAILAVGAAREEPVAVDGRLGVATVMRLTLSVDHRPVDGVIGARWLAALTDLLEHPARILA